MAIGGSLVSSQTLDIMYPIRLALMGTSLALGACASTRNEPDETCRAIAAFANAAEDVGHSVRLMTDWGGSYHKSEDPNEQVFSAKDCVNDGFEPGKALCNYLLENTSTEFAAINYRRALECIGFESNGRSPIDDNDLLPSAVSRNVVGVRRNVEVKVGFTHGTDTEPPTFTIAARKTR